MRQLMNADNQDPMLPQTYRVKKVFKETYDTFTFELHSNDAPADFVFLPGQFNMLYVFGVGEIPISISGDPNHPKTLIHTTRAVGTVTKAMWKLEPGDSLGVRGPFGTSWPVKDAEGSDVVIVAGGLGLAPLRPAMYQILAQREKYGNVVLFYGARTPEDILYKRQIKKWRSQFDLEVHVTAPLLDLTLVNSFSERAKKPTISISFATGKPHLKFIPRTAAPSPSKRLAKAMF